MEDEPSPAALEQKPLPVFGGFELSPRRPHSNPYGGTGRPQVGRVQLQYGRNASEGAPLLAPNQV